jgi:pilus assembly protein CpaE
MSVASAANARECLDRIRARLSPDSPLIGVTDHVYCFLPSKPGVGSTTLAVNAALLAAQLGTERVFLGDFDLGCGTVGFLLRLREDYSIQDAAQRVLELDENLWPQMVHSRGNLDVVPSGPIGLNTTMEPYQARRLIEYVRRTYGLVIADLSGQIDQHSVEVMQEAKRIFLVTAPDLSALHLARVKLRYLERLQLARKVVLLLNRCTKAQAFTRKEIQELIGLPVEMSFSEDTNSVLESAKNASGVNAKSELARAIKKLADTLTPKNPSPAPPRRQRFVEYFSIVPGRY